MVWPSTQPTCWQQLPKLRRQSTRQANRRALRKRNGPHPYSINVFVRRSVSVDRRSSYFLPGAMLRTGRPENGGVMRGLWVEMPGPHQGLRWSTRPGPVPVRNRHRAFKCLSRLERRLLIADGRTAELSGEGGGNIWISEAPANVVPIIFMSP